MPIAGYPHSLTSTGWINRTRTGLKFAARNGEVIASDLCERFLVIEQLRIVLPATPGCPTSFRNLCIIRPFSRRRMMQRFFTNGTTLPPFEQRGKQKFSEKPKRRKNAVYR